MNTIFGKNIEPDSIVSSEDSHTHSTEMPNSNNSCEQDVIAEDHPYSSQEEFSDLPAPLKMPANLTSTDSTMHSANQLDDQSIKPAVNNFRFIYTKEKTYVCTLCNETILRKDSLSKHVVFHKNKVESSKLSEYLKTPPYLESSVSTMHTFRPLENQLNKPVAKNFTFIQTKEGAYVCTLCNETILQKDSLSSHVAIHRNKVEVPDLSGHQKMPADTASSVSTMQTTDLLNNESIKPAIKEFKFIHTKENTYLCTLCNKTVLHKNLKTHVANVHTKKNGGHLCNLCNKKFYHKFNLYQHKIKKHKQEKLFPCNTCNRRFLDQSCLDAHKCCYSRTKSCYTCNVCRKSFSDRTRLKRHASVHSNEKPYSCDLCDKSFKQKRSVLDHKIIYHVNRPAKTKKVFNCSWCERTFPNEGGLKRHEMFHTGEKPYVCDICLKGFRRNYNVIQHKLTHTGEKPFACSACNQRFTQKHAVKKHYKRFHLKK